MSIVHFRIATRRKHIEEERAVETNSTWNERQFANCLTHYVNNVIWSKKQTNNTLNQWQSLEQRKKPNWISHPLVARFMLYIVFIRLVITHTHSRYSGLVFGISESWSDYADNFFFASVWVNRGWIECLSVLCTRQCSRSCCWNCDFSMTLLEWALFRCCENDFDLSTMSCVYCSLVIEHTDRLRDFTISVVVWTRF